MTKKSTFLTFILITGMALAISGCGNDSSSTGADDPSANNPPEILSISADPQSIIIGGSTSIVVDAVDPEGDFLYYGWNASGGSIAGNGPAAVWNAPENIGTYIISVYIEDDRQGRVNSDVEITVTEAGNTNRPPVIRYINSDPDILPTLGQSHITVSAYDPDGDDLDLTYHWGGPGGEFQGHGAEVTWTAPNPGCCPTTLYVWVLVSDSGGATSTRSTGIVVIP